MNLGEMQEVLALLVDDKALQLRFPQMLNDAIMEIAADFDLPALLLQEPVSLGVTTNDWLYSLPANYQKKLKRCHNALGHRVRIRLPLDELNRLNMLHDRTGGEVEQVGVMDAGEDKTLGIYPKANDTLSLWYYKKPERLEKSGDVPICIPAPYHERVIISKCVIKNFQYFTDFIEDGPIKSLQYWHGLYRDGIYGSPGSGPGLINYLIKAQGGPRRRGGRDPVGYQPWPWPR